MSENLCPNCEASRWNNERSTCSRIACPFTTLSTLESRLQEAERRAEKAIEEASALASGQNKLETRTESAERQLAELRAENAEARVKQLEILLGSVAPVAELTGTKPLVLYFENDADREEFVALVREAKPDMVSVSL